MRSRPTRGAWIEIQPIEFARNGAWGRAPHGARGLKFQNGYKLGDRQMSRPTRGAWIEISITRCLATALTVAPHAGAWIEMAKSNVKQDGKRESRPTRARGLKSGTTPRQKDAHASRPTRARGLKFAVMF
ncbi:hypothetical protein SELSPUOL_02686 [Selenomonas sputigena ATCC 35185]|uniref:Uncharacterized protein n=1 Tax=Selenomonas sputigena (strain ATCC 35185 / DSM 20758 / CCUG 44933 / VPI D19B-28) TaxID=546271 RepID=C9LYX5_SELS3|nr:hypothetical protein SELSPUOL_02686 [Selenomonas sputigena ATCC 35185]